LTVDIINQNHQNNRVGGFDCFGKLSTSLNNLGSKTSILFQCFDNTSASSAQG